MFKAGVTQLFGTTTKSNYQLYYQLYFTICDTDYKLYFTICETAE